MGYGNWNMWLLKLVWVARNNFACEVYVHPFSEKHVKEVNFHFKDKGFSQKCYLRSVDEQELFTEEWVFGNSQVKCTPHDCSSLYDSTDFVSCTDIFPFFIGKKCEQLKPVGIFL